MPAKTVVLAPIIKTRSMHRLTRSGPSKSAECWGAETTDGEWDFEREESPGTPWAVYHKPSCTDGSYPWVVMFCGTLRGCRALAASGGLGQELALRKAGD